MAKFWDWKTTTFAVALSMFGIGFWLGIWGFYHPILSLVVGICGAVSVLIALDAYLSSRKEFHKEPEERRDCW
jgi:multisubunit Na+/H+ antiporter MnhB subunit